MILMSIKIKQFKINALYKEYAEGLRLAKMVLQKFSYSIVETNTKDSNKIPPFYIDMSLLFELYVYGKLKQEFGNKITYQVQGSYGKVDFLRIDEKLIIDTKYKTYYSELFKGNESWKRDKMIKDIRQLSGYARDIGILEKFGNINTVIDCIIIYPNNSSETDFKERNLKEARIDQFLQFYKCGIQLPLKDKNID
jgi:5-methylcytosine-specific restriction enzyme subunit McrC